MRFLATTGKRTIHLKPQYRHCHLADRERHLANGQSLSTTQPTSVEPSGKHQTQQYRSPHVPLSDSDRASTAGQSPTADGQPIAASARLTQPFVQGDILARTAIPTPILAHRHQHNLAEMVGALSVER